MPSTPRRQQLADSAPAPLGGATRSTQHLFTYGSLMFAEVWSRVVHGIYRQMPARAEGFGRYAVRGESYPGLVPEPRSSVEGVVYFDVSPADVASLDVFEGEQYQRQVIHVRVTGGDAIAVHAYVFTATHLLDAKRWLPEEFALLRFLESYCAPRLGR